MTDRVVEHPGRYQLVPVAGTTDQFDLVAVPGTVTAAGTTLNKENLLTDATATALGLDPEDDSTPNDAFAAIPEKINTKADKYELIQSYTAAGSYTYTPDFTGAVLVCLIGGGGSGSVAPGTVSGGASGEALVLEDYDVTEDVGISVVVGAGGAAATYSGSSLDGNNGGTSSFDGQTAAGGGGGIKYGLSNVPGAPGANGGQCSLGVGGAGTVPASVYGFGIEAAYYGGEQVSAIGSGNSAYNGPVSGFSRSKAAFNKMAKYGVMPFTLCAGNSVMTGSNIKLTFASITLPNGNTSSASDYNSTDVVLLAAGSDPGCGGGALMTSKSGNASAPGADGGVFIYRKM